MELTKEQLERYERQIRYFGELGQKSLLSKHVLQVGAGGLGSPLSLYLVAAGIGELTIIDYDEVSLSNLNRQILYGTEDVGKNKPITAQKRLNYLNSDVKINTIEKKINENNFSELCKGVDYIVDASDNFTTKFLVNDTCLKLNIPFTIAGVKALEGQIMSVIPHETACYRCVFGSMEEKVTNSEKRDKIKNTLGVIGVTCGILGIMEATEVIKALLEMEGRLLNKLLMADFKMMRFMSVELTKDDACIC